MRSSQYNSFMQPGRVVADTGRADNILYGPFSFSVSDGIHAFINWLNQQSHPYGRILAKWSPGSREFSAAWMFLGANDPHGFFALQEDYQQRARALA